MDIANLIQMANRIGDFYVSFADHEEALQEVANHIHKFWPARMRREILLQLDQPAAADLLPLVREALRRYREQLTPAS